MPSDSPGRSLPDDPSSLASDRHRGAFHEALVAWYENNKRVMPWRASGDPYRIWVSEIMLQQTRVDQAEPYFNRFMEAFPTVEALAAASQDEVLQAWEGLGYYSRARHLHAAAQHVVDEHDGAVPSTYDEIRALKGIGPYTAAAVLSIAFNKPHAVLDGNVMRVLARVFAIEDDVRSSRTKRLLQDLADALLEPTDPGTYNQAVMELGALVCTPRNPECTACPLATVCEAKAQGLQDRYPVKSKKPPVPHYEIAVGLVFDDEGRLLIQQRPDDAMLGGLWEFPGGKQEPDEPLEETCRRELREELQIEVAVEAPFYTLDHAYSHFKITMHAFVCRIEAGTPTPPDGVPMAWASIDALSDYAFPRANRRIIEALEERQQQPHLFDALPSEA